MKTTLYAIAALTLLSSAAQAWEVRTSCSHSRFYGSTSCRTVGIEDYPRIRDEAREAEDYRARQETIKKWETFCKPTRTYDNFGMVRLVYARNGCEFGRNE
jgi:hypothetical protein